MVRLTQRNLSRPMPRCDLTSLCRYRVVFAAMSEDEIAELFDTPVSSRYWPDTSYSMPMLASRSTAYTCC